MSLRRIVPWLLILAGLLILGAGVIRLTIGQAAANPQAAPLPKQVGGLPLTIVDTGRQAAFEISRLHQKTFPLISASVGIYQGEYNAQIWASGFSFRWMAKQMARSMSESIASGTDLPFRPTGERVIDGHTVYTLEGLGQQHFFFTSGRLVIWLAADPEIADQALRDTLAFYSQEGR